MGALKIGQYDEHASRWADHLVSSACRKVCSEDAKDGGLVHSMTLLLEVLLVVPPRLEARKRMYPNKEDGGGATRNKSGILQILSQKGTRVIS